MEVDGQPFLNIILKYMSRLGFRRFILSTGYKSDIIAAYYSAHRIEGIDISFSRESFPLGTGGALKKAKKAIESGTFFVMNGDIYCKFDPSRFLKFHEQKRAAASILLRRIADAGNYGSVTLDDASRVVKFEEKKKNSKNCLISSGIYVFNKNVFDLMPARAVFSLEYDFFPKLAGGNIFGCEDNGLFIDIGTPRGYSGAKKHFQAPAA